MRWSQTPADTFLLAERLIGLAERRPALSPLMTGNARHAFSSTYIRSSRGLKEERRVGQVADGPVPYFRSQLSAHSRSNRDKRG